MLDTPTAAPDQARRKSWIEVLSKAPGPDLMAAFQALDMSPDFTWLRTPEMGTVMVRGRMGGTGAPFNMGEMTVTRCSLRLGDGRVGHSYIAGRDADRARVAALCDALMLGDEAPAVQATVITPLEQQIAAGRKAHAAKAAATKVDFFTMVRGER